MNNSNRQSPDTAKRELMLRAGAVVAGAALVSSNSAHALVADNVTTVDTLAELRTQAGPSSEVVFMRGYFTAGDGGEGLFQWRSATLADNGGTLIVPNSGGGHWQRVDAGKTVRPEWFGAVLGLSGNNLPALQAAVNNSKEVVLGGKYYLAGTLAIATPGVVLRGEGDVLITTSASAKTHLIEISADDVSIQDLEFSGITQLAGGSTITGEVINIISILDCDRVTVSGCTFRDFTVANYLRGIHVGNSAAALSRDFSIRNNLFENLSAASNGSDTDWAGSCRAIFVGGDNATQISQAAGIIAGNIIRNLPSAEDHDAIHIQLLNAPLPVAIKISDNVITNVGKRGIKVQAPGVEVSNNLIQNYGSPSSYAYAGIECFYGNTLITGNVVKGYFRLGIKVNGYSNYQVLNNKVLLPADLLLNPKAQGINATQTTDAQVCGNKVYTADTGVQLYQCQRTNVADTDIRAGYIGVHIYQSSTCVLDNVTVSDAGTMGVFLHSTCSSITFAHCRAYNLAGHFVRAEDNASLSDIRLIGLETFGVQGSLVYFDDISRALVDNCQHNTLGMGSAGPLMTLVGSFSQLTLRNNIYFGAGNLLSGGGSPGPTLVGNEQW